MRYLKGKLVFVCLLACLHEAVNRFDENSRSINFTPAEKEEKEEEEAKEKKHKEQVRSDNKFL